MNACCAGKIFASLKPLNPNREDNVKPAVVIGVILIVLGALALGYQGITYTSHKKVLDIGPVQATTSTRKTIPLPPVLGAIAVAGGTLLLVAGRRRN